MTKQEELDDPNSCFNKAGKDEQIFVLRGKDVSSPAIILEWIKLNFHSSPVIKLNDAFHIAQKMKMILGRKIAD